MPQLFDSTKIKTLAVKNRFVRSATWEGMASDRGECTPQLIKCMTDLVEGGIGLIISGHTFVSPEGQAGPWQLAIHNDDFIPDLTQMTQAVHDKGGKIVLQLAHAGIQAAEKLTQTIAIGPSAIEGEKGTIGKEMTHEDIQRVVNAFGDGAVRAKKAGFDGVQIHGAHGYFLSQFLSPYYNKRNDEYGGAIENRARIVLEVLKNIRSKVGDDFPVMIKINSEDFLDNGFTVDDMLLTAKMLEDAGIDAIELSGGTIASGKKSPIRKTDPKSEDEEVYYLEAAKQYKQKINVPLMLVGGIRSFSVAQKLIEQGHADYISLCRPLIREPGLINRWQSGDTSRATCISCQKCFVPAMKGEGLKCVVG